MSANTTLTKSEARSQFGEAFAEFLRNFDADLSPFEIDQEVKFHMTRLGSVALITEAELSKAFRDATEDYGRKHQAGWDLQPVRKAAPGHRRNPETALAVRQYIRLGY